MLVGSTDKNTTADTWYYRVEDRRRYVDLYRYVILQDTVQFNIAKHHVKWQSETGLIR